MLSNDERRRRQRSTRKNFFAIGASCFPFVRFPAASAPASVAFQGQPSRGMPRGYHAGSPERFKQTVWREISARAGDEDFAAFDGSGGGGGCSREEAKRSSLFFFFFSLAHLFFFFFFFLFSSSSSSSSSLPLSLSLKPPPPTQQKWSKGKMKEKVNNLVLFDKVRTKTTKKKEKKKAFFN